MLNGVDRLIMMKADVLNDMEDIQICTRYETDGILTEKLPFNLGDEAIHPVYETLPGWNTSPDVSMGFDGLPINLKEYTGFIENATGLPVDIISMGPDRTQTIFRKGD
jgi:adenylosuccinate synthase